MKLGLTSNTHRLNNKRLHTGFGVIVVLLYKARIDDIDNSVNCDGGFSNIRS